MAPRSPQLEQLEAAAVESAVAAHQKALPQNMFAPFSCGHPNPAKVSPAPMVHWGNVDTGAMVNLVYAGVLSTFPELHEYLQPYQHTVVGVGGNATKVIGKLVNVPTFLGAT